MANAAAQLSPRRAPVAARKWGTCALVGNSGMLRMAEFGASIDSHDTVLRVNQAPTIGYSRRVGTKVCNAVGQYGYSRCRAARQPGGYSRRVGTKTRGPLLLTRARVHVALSLRTIALNVHHIALSIRTIALNVHHIALSIHPVALNARHIRAWQVTHRVFNRLWTRAYYSSQSQKKNKALEQYPLEPDMTLLITRATLKEYGLLAAQLAETRPDVLAARVSSRACSMAQVQCLNRNIPHPPTNHRSSIGIYLTHRPITGPQ
eukprot:90481-Prorocentrum_minimum.AAC.1